MLADGAGTEKCHHFIKSIPSFALKKKEERKKESCRKEKEKKGKITEHLHEVNSQLPFLYN